MRYLIRRYFFLNYRLKNNVVFSIFLFNNTSYISYISYIILISLLFSLNSGSMKKNDFIILFIFGYFMFYFVINYSLIILLIITLLMCLFCISLIIILLYYYIYFIIVYIFLNFNKCENLHFFSDKIKLLAIHHNNFYFFYMIFI